MDEAQSSAHSPTVLTVPASFISALSARHMAPVFKTSKWATPSPFISYPATPTAVEPLGHSDFKLHSPGEGVFIRGPGLHLGCVNDFDRQHNVSTEHVAKLLTLGGHWALQPLPPHAYDLMFSWALYPIISKVRMPIGEKPSLHMDSPVALPWPAVFLLPATHSSSAPLGIR